MLNLEKMLKENGELMIKMSDGETFELHLHNTSFGEGVIVIDAGGEKYWLKTEEIVYAWIHREAK